MPGKHVLALPARGGQIFPPLAALLLLPPVFWAVWQKLRSTWISKLSCLKREPPLKRKVRVAIVGAGVGGTALAHWLRELYGDDLELAVVSDGPVGGRCQGVKIGSSTYEGGAAIISEVNEYMIGFMKKLGLKSKYIKGVSKPVGVFDGTLMRFQEPDPRNGFLGLRKFGILMGAWRLVTRYGFSALKRTQQIMKNCQVPSFPHLYKRLAKGEAFLNPRAMLEALGPSSNCLTQISAADWLYSPTGGRLPVNVVDELVAAGMRSNYGGQDCQSLHAFVGVVSIAGGLATRCFAIKGGNAQVPEGLLRLARPQKLLTGVTARVIRRTMRRPEWEVLVEIGSSGESMKGDGSPPPVRPLQAEGPFDVVVVAHPLERSCLHFEGEGVAPLKVPGKFRRCYVQFVTGALRQTYFNKGLTGKTTPSGKLPLDLLTCRGSTAPFYSIGLQVPVGADKVDTQKLYDEALDGNEAVFKIFSPAPLTDVQLDEIFVRRQKYVTALDWYAYPEYTAPQEFVPFAIGGGIDCPSLVYLNAIEQVASAMEMSAISARNGVNLVMNFVDRHRGLSGWF